MSDEFNYLSLNQNNDQKEPLISENQINLNDSSNIVENLKTLTHCETKQLYEEDINNNANNLNTKVQQYSSSEDESSNAEKNAELFKKQQDNAIRKLIWVCVNSWRIFS